MTENNKATHTTAPRIMPPKNESPSNFRPVSFGEYFTVVFGGLSVGDTTEVWRGTAVLVTITALIVGMNDELADFKTTSLTLTIKKKHWSY